MTTCAYCGGLLGGGGQGGGDYCDSPLCRGNYYGGNKDREDENTYLTGLLARDPREWREQLDYRASLSYEEQAGRWWEDK